LNWLLARFLNRKLVLIYIFGGEKTCFANRIKVIAFSDGKRMKWLLLEVFLGLLSSLSEQLGPILFFAACFGIGAPFGFPNGEEREKARIVFFSPFPQAIIRPSHCC
jgi:hypothetical protein